MPAGLAEGKPAHKLNHGQRRGTRTFQDAAKQIELNRGVGFVTRRTKGQKSLAPQRSQRSVELATTQIEQRLIGQLIDAQAAIDAAENEVDATAVFDIGQRHRREQKARIHAPQHAGLGSIHREHVAKRRTAEQQPAALPWRLHAELARRGKRQAHKAPLRKQQRAQATIATNALDSATRVSDDQFVLAQHQIGDFAGQKRHF